MVANVKYFEIQYQTWVKVLSDFDAKTSFIIILYLGEIWKNFHDVASLDNTFLLSSFLAIVHLYLNNYYYIRVLILSET